MPDDVYAVKVKGPKDRVWYFIGSGGTETRLRIHAVMIRGHDGKSAKERAETYAGQIMADEPDYQAKAVPFWKGGA